MKKAIQDTEKRQQVMRGGADLSSGAYALTPPWLRPQEPAAPKVGRPLGRTLKLAEVEAATREVYEAGGPDLVPTAEQVAERLSVSPKTISRVVRAGGWSDFRRWTRQLGLT